MGRVPVYVDLRSGVKRETLPTFVIVVLNISDFKRYVTYFIYCTADLKSSNSIEKSEKIRRKIIQFDSTAPISHPVP